jgi:hypothetical protein
MAGSGLAAPAPILTAMFVLANGLHATRFPIGLTVAVIRGQRATGPARDHAQRPRHPVAKKFIADRVQEPRSRLAAWTIAFLGRGRAERAITAPQVFSRQALAASRPGRRGR